MEILKCVLRLFSLYELLWIEIDWWYHLKRQGYDKARDSEIKHKWIKVIRFKNEEIENNLEWVLEELEEIIGEKI